MASLRCFIAIELPSELRKRLVSLARQINAEGVVPVAEQNLHITLRFLGDTTYDKLAAIEEKLRAIRFKPFAVRVGKVGVFPNENYVRVVWAGCESSELAGLAKKIDTALSGMFQEEEFAPHITIARVKKKVNVRAFLGAHKEEELGKFEIRGFVLKSSQLTGSGPVYSTIAEFGQD